MSKNFMQDELLQEQSQFRLRRMQLVDWGTFSGLHDIDVAEEGHLFVGGSGSGKSTLLDAMSVLLTPGQINFNAAAREGEKRSDRTMLTYMRGAWTKQHDEDGKAAVQFLREKSTWSAIALTYRNHFDQAVTLLFVGFIRGNTRDDARVNRQYFVMEDDFDLAKILDFNQTNFDWRALKKKLPVSAHAFPRFAPYCEWFRRLFGIQEETVLKLLHKAQSARNLGDLNTFLRDYMLDKPETFDVADTLVAEFTELKEAHEAVKRARAQTVLLETAHTAYVSYEELGRRLTELSAMQEGVDAWGESESCRLLKEELPRLQKKLTLAAADYDVRDNERKRLAERIESLRSLEASKGGADLAKLKRELASVTAALKSTEVRREQASERLAKLSKKLPQGREGWTALTQQLDSERQSAAKGAAECQNRRDEAGFSLRQKESDFKALCTEIAAMEKTPSNIPFKLLSLREEAAEALGIDVSDLPFAGELMEVKESEARWQGALERVLHGFALSVIVRERDYPAFSDYVNNRHLGLKLVYLKMTENEAAGRDAADTVAVKLNFQEGAFGDWVHREITSRFAYVCTEDMEEFRRAQRAVTITGQIKHAGNRHEKDDRFKINDRTRWVTGFTNEKKLAAYKEEAAVKAQEISELQKAVERIEAEQKTVRERLFSLQSVLETRWEDIDVSDLSTRRDGISSQISVIESRSEDLRAIARDIEAARAEEENVLRSVMQAHAARQEAQKAVDDNMREAQNAAARLAQESVSEDVLLLITKKAQEAGAVPASSSGVERCCARLMNVLAAEDKKASLERENHQHVVTDCFRSFIEKWRAEARELDETLASAREFFVMLEKLQTDGLPRFEARFKELLQNHARQNLADLFNEIEDERKLIKTRMLEVNKSLAKVPFNRTGGRISHLRINVTDRNLAEVQEFAALHAQIMRNPLEEPTREEAEHYFARLEELVEELKGLDPAAARWRERVLDVRLHVSFEGVEFDPETEAVLEVYDSGAGKSGGQRQKLSITCLAAALRYQLGGSEDSLPSYAAVILDEAFDKADSEFTDISLQIFKRFGFQLIIATPEKAVYTLEPYIGGSTFVSCPDRKTSLTLAIAFNPENGEPVKVKAPVRTTEVPAVQAVKPEPAAMTAEKPEKDEPVPQTQDLFGGETEP